MTATLILASTYLVMAAVTRSFSEELYEYDVVIRVITSITTVTVAAAQFNEEAFIISLATITLLAIPSWIKPMFLGVLTCFLTPVLGIPLLVAQSTQHSTTPQPRLYAAAFLLSTITLIA